MTGVPVITPDASRFNLTWWIHKDDVSSISCDGDCDVIIWIKTRSFNAFEDSFGSWEYKGLYSSRTVLSNFTRLFTTNAKLFIMWLCIYVTTCIYCCQEHMVNKI